MADHATEATLQQIVARHLRVRPEAVALDRDLLEELGLDSTDVATILMDIEDAFPHVSLSDAAAAQTRTLGGLAAFIDARHAGDASTNASGGSLEGDDS